MVMKTTTTIAVARRRGGEGCMVMTNDDDDGGGNDSDGLNGYHRYLDKDFSHSLSSIIANEKVDKFCHFSKILSFVVGKPE